MVASCDGIKEDPVQTVESYIKAIDQFRFDKAQTLVTQDFLPTLIQMKTVSNSLSESHRKERLKDAARRKYKFVLQQEDPESATVRMTTQGLHGEVAINYLLKKIDGKWLINDQVEE